MHLSDLQEKEIISLKDGRNLGRIIDATISAEGLVLELIVEEKRGFFFRRGEEHTINFQQIHKIGQDVILIDL